MTKVAIAMPYQKEGVRLIERKFKGRALLADDMGLGKTLEALWYIKRNPDCWPVLIVCEANVKYKWEHEAQVHCGLTVEICEGQKPPSRVPKMVRPHVVICNYDILIYWEEYLAKCGFRGIVIDECQNISNLEAQRTQVVHQMATGLRHVLALSGTPMMNRPIELFSALHLIRPDVFQGMMQFALQFCRPRLVRGKWQYTGARNLPALNKLLKETCMVRRLKEEVLPDLPPIVRSVVPVPIADMSEYHHANNDFKNWVKLYKPTRAKKALKAEAVVKVNYLLELCAKLKLPGICAWVDNWLKETEDKIVLFAHHKKMVAALHRRYPGSVVIDGDATARQKQLAVDMFQHSPKCRTLVGSLSATKGVTLTTGNTVGFTQFWWRPADHTQGESRVNRFTQTQNTWAYYFTAPNTIEEWLCELIQDKQDDVSDTLDGKGKGEKLPIFDLLLERINKGLL